MENQELWEDDGPHSSTAGCFSPVGATGDLGACVCFFLAFAEVVSVVEDTGAVAGSPAGAKTV